MDLEVRCIDLILNGSSYYCRVIVFDSLEFNAFKNQVTNETMSQLLLILVIIAYGDIVLGIATLDVPNLSNCGDQVVLVCKSEENCANAYIFSRNGVLIYNQRGPQYGINGTRYAISVSKHQVQLTISNLQQSDTGLFGCNCGYDEMTSGQELQYECRAATSIAATDSSKKLHITVDRLYPNSTNMTTTLNSPTRNLQGTYTCGASPTTENHYKCTWVSTASLPDGIHSYNITITTVTQAAPLTGSFKIVTPMSPTISNLQTMSNRQVIRGVQDTLLTIQCVSNGGIPVPTLAWYKSNMSTPPLALTTTLDSTQELDGTYTVIMNYSFAPNRTDDLKPYMCRLFYPGATKEATLDPSPASAILFLELKPEIHPVLQTGQAVSGGTMTLRCIANNGRPAPSITWSYPLQNISVNTAQSINITSETYTVVSTLQRTVSAEDNGLTATCTVVHTTMPVPIDGSVVVDVKFGPSTQSTSITGKETTPSTATNRIRLNCTSGSSSPASNITWYNGSEVIPNTAGYTRWHGNNNGVITSNILTITPTRYMDGDRLKCKSDNGYGSDSTYVDLDILYSPLIKPLLSSTSIEGKPDVSLMCEASSKPPANFTWKKGNTVLAIGIGTITNNSFSYTIPRVSRADAGSYQCQAGNGIGSSDQKYMYLNVAYPPTVTVSVTTTQSYTVKCTANGYPDNYTYQDWLQIWPGYGPVATIPFTGTTLTLINVTYESSGVYVCGASNGVAVYGTDVKFMKGNITIFIKAPPVLTDPSLDGIKVVAGKLGQDAVTEIKYWSNLNDNVVKCYKLVGGSRSSFSNCSVTETETKVKLPVYNHTVTEIGTLATIKIPILIPADMTSYDVVVWNNMNVESVLSIVIVPQGPPDGPTLIGNFSIIPGQVTLTVLPGFHGGYNQTIVVQISTDLITWINKSSVYVGQELQSKDVILTSLKEETLHYVRVFAYNIEGGSKNFSSIMSFTTAKDPLTKSTSAAIIGSAVGTTCALLLVAVVLVVLWRNREAEWTFFKKGDRRSFAEDQDNSDSVVECAMYVSSGNVQPGTCVEYAIPQKRRRVDPSANVYAVVSKTKKGSENVKANTTEDPKVAKKIGKPGKPTQALPNIPHVVKTNVDSTNAQTSNPPPLCMKNVNDDGLIYADLEFDSTAKYDVTHGLDDVTIYVEIDFTKTAKPLPDSDEESSKTK